MIESQIHRFLKHKIGLVFEELGCESGTEIIYSNANLDRCANMIEEYMGLDLEEPGIVDEFDMYRMELDEYE